MRRPIAGAVKQSNTAFVTGGAGFVGGRLIDRLLARGYRVSALAFRRPLAAAVRVVRGDLRDIAGFAEGLRGADTVFHCAAALDPVTSAAEADEVNHRATLQLAQAARDAGARCFVSISSIAAIGIHDSPVPLTTAAACRPTTAYGKSKRAGEVALLEMDAGAMRCVIVRPPTVYGPRECRNFLALTRALNTGLFVVPGGGQNLMSFCHLDNLVAALIWLAEDDRARGIYHITDPEPVRLAQVVRTLASAVGRSPLPIPFPLAVARVVARGFDLAGRLTGRTPPLSTARLRTLTSNWALDTRELRALGFVPPVSFADGVAETVEWYRQQGLLS